MENDKITNDENTQLNRLPATVCSAGSDDGLRKPTYDELHEFARTVWSTAGAATSTNEIMNPKYFNDEGNRLFIEPTVPRKFT